MKTARLSALFQGAGNFIIGRRLGNFEGKEQKIGPFAGVAAMGLDGLSSAAYGPEAAMIILAPLGAASLSLTFPIMLAVIGLLLVLYASYWQIITAYPSNGGAYTVASENLGPASGLLAATALMVDYTLNVAVGISAGIGALTSAMPMLAPHTLLLCLAVLILVTFVNLRGTSEAGATFLVPTCIFVASWILILGLGLWFVARTGGHPAPVIAPPAGPQPQQALDLWIVLCAFANGCTAMTGVEAVSNGVSAFREPSARNAHRTLSLIVVLLAILLGGIAYLVRFYGIFAMDQNQPGYQSVLSQLAKAVIGNGILYYIAIASVLAVLSLAANTSFTGFPRLCRQLAHDHFLPKAFELPGRRLVFTAGIIFLAAAAGVLLIVFNGITNALIPLFAIGAFTAFVMSQVGIAVYWWRQRGTAKRGWLVRMIINGFGAVLTSLALLIIIITKFAAGAWITLIAVPLLFILLWRIRTYYAVLKRHLAYGPLEFQTEGSPIVIVVFETWNALSAKAVKFGMRMSDDVTAIHLTAIEGPEGDENEQQLHNEWHSNVEIPARRAGFTPPAMLFVKSPYRRFLKPLVRLVREAEHRNPNRMVAVLIPELVKLRWWDYLLHSLRARRLRNAIMQGHSARTIVIDVPWHMEQDSGQPVHPPEMQDNG